jgi:hypothetical protein
MITFNNIILTTIVILITITLFLSLKKSHPTSEMMNSENRTLPHFRENRIHPNFKYNTTQCKETKRDCPVAKNDLKTDYYIDKFLMGDRKEICPLPPISNKEFNNNFFKFRDYTYDNSSMTMDSVDKVANLQLDGFIGEARRYPNTKIRDIFDNLTCGPNLYLKQCVRVPKFDNTMQDGYNYNFVTGMENTRDNWKYPDESVMNGGNFMGKIHGRDPEEIKQFPVID